jgi:hypothetical protein
MIETKELVRILGVTVRDLVRSGDAPLFGEILSLGRKLKNGQVQIIDTETYAGPDGSKAPYGYVRFRDGAREHSFQSVKGYTAAPALEIRAHLRFVGVHRCANESGLQSSILAALLVAGVKNQNLFTIRPMGSSARGQTVQREETKGDERGTEPDSEAGQNFLGEARLLAIDFDLVYTLSGDESACTFSCDACC